MRKRRNSLNNDVPLLFDDVELQENALLSGESILWTHLRPMPKAVFGAICGSLSLCVFLIVMMFVMITFAPEFKSEILGFFLIPSGFLLVATVYFWWINNGDYYYLLTNQRVITCFLKKGSYTKMTTVPYDVISSVERDHHTVTFFVKSLSSAELDDDDIPQLRQQKYIRFEHIEDPEEVEGIVNNAMSTKTTSTENVHLREPTTSLSTDDWPKAFQTLLASVKERSSSENTEAEKLLWVNKASAWLLWRKLIAIFVSLESLVALLTYLSGFIAVFIIGTLIAIFAVGQAWVLLYLVRQAYCVTNKGLTILRTGLPQPIGQEPDQVKAEGWNHVVKMPFNGIYPLIITHNFKTGSGEVQVLSNYLSNLVVTVPDMDNFCILLMEGLQYSTNKA